MKKDQKLQIKKSRFNSNTVSCIMLTAECSTVPETERMTGISAFTLSLVRSDKRQSFVRKCILYVLCD